jgi:hypothetical protein
MSATLKNILISLEIYTNLNILNRCSLMGETVGVSEDIFWYTTQYRPQERALPSH